VTVVEAWIRRHPLLSYIVLTFAISWGGVLMTIGTGGFHGTTVQNDPLFPIAVVAMLAGPSIAGVLLTLLVYGVPGLRQLLARLQIWRVGARWYAVALLAPVVFTVIPLALSLASPVFLPGIVTASDRGSLLLVGLSVAVVVGFFEELGWTGFAVPTMKLRHGVLATGVVVGAVWGAWHFLTNVLLATGTSAGQLPVATYLIGRSVGLLIGGLPAFRVLMVLVYERTGSLPVAMLMHVSLTASTLILGPLAISGANLLISDLVMSAAWWLVVVAALRAFIQQPARASSDKISNPPHHRAVWN
jgi:uncharacterized protein